MGGVHSPGTRVLGMDSAEGEPKVGEFRCSSCFPGKKTLQLQNNKKYNEVKF
jgi:hypothetical protein